MNPTTTFDVSRPLFGITALALSLQAGSLADTITVVSTCIA